MSLFTEYRDVLRLIDHWPAEQRLSLAREILSHQGGPLPVPRSTADLAAGLLSGRLPPPDDDDVKRILHEHRMEKYGK